MSISFEHSSSVVLPDFHQNNTCYQRRKKPTYFICYFAFQILKEHFCSLISDVCISEKNPVLSISQVSHGPPWVEADSSVHLLEMLAARGTWQHHVGTMKLSRGYARHLGDRRPLTGCFQNLSDQGSEHSLVKR